MHGVYGIERKPVPVLRKSNSMRRAPRRSRLRSTLPLRGRKGVPPAPGLAEAGCARQSHASPSGCPVPARRPGHVRSNADDEVVDGDFQGLGDPHQVFVHGTARSLAVTLHRTLETGDRQPDTEARLAQVQDIIEQLSPGGTLVPRPPPLRKSAASQAASGV